MKPRLNLLLTTFLFHTICYTLKNHKLGNTISEWEITFTLQILKMTFNSSALKVFPRKQEHRYIK